MLQKLLNVIQKSVYSSFLGVSVSLVLDPLPTIHTSLCCWRRREKRAPSITYYHNSTYCISLFCCRKRSVSGPEILRLDPTKVKGPIIEQCFSSMIYCIMT